MSIVTPGVGLIFWTAVAFLIVFLILGLKVFPQISAALRDREDSIDKALKDAEEARTSVTDLKSTIEDMKKEARAEREEILNDAKANANKIVQEAKEQAQTEAKLILDNANASIVAERQAAMNEVKAQLAEMSISIAEKILNEKLSTDAAQEKLVAELVEEVSAVR
ncbi:F0F1 ATP synthase subunit B [Sediminitomix flava]|uniref:ATP synthase subunit b n=1 Tax=Sediminitomix flava TaxID=379075 RepID=A0A315ZHA0_SEDFL|nr:F0F1 ATP synthase subunit B [Sediminitomix flava]PWJ44094.1 ATP synthase F0 subcomplex B subunit [Sediminitomix flava]